MDAAENLLFGMLALQNGFVDQHALLSALEDWTADRTRGLDAMLTAAGQLDADQCRLLWALVEQQLKHDGPAVLCAASAERGSSVRKGASGALPASAQPAQPRLAATLGCAQPQRPAVATSKGQPCAADEYKTRPAAAGTVTSSGRRFDILRPLAKGGIGQVWVAQDMELRREVAFKELQEQFADNDDFRDDFVLEAEITGGLEHPCIVPIYGLGQHPDGRPFYAMRFVRGESLHDAIRRFHAETAKVQESGNRSLKLHKILTRFVHACNAVEYAHSRGVIHRDLKPLNIMLGKFGETFVVDWGEAKPLDHLAHANAGEEPRLQTSCSRDTDRMGKPVGTPAYMSPEQAAGRHDLLGPTSDVYCLGATLYHILTGRAPIGECDSGLALQKAMKNDVRPPREVNKSVPRPLAAICQKAMAPKPADRYPSARALADDVEHWLADERVSAHAESWPQRTFRLMRSHKAATSALAAALAVLIFGGGLAVEISRRENDRTRAYDLAEALLEANASAVPHLLDALNPYGEVAAACVRDCRQRADRDKNGGSDKPISVVDAEKVAALRRLREAYALANLGEAPAQTAYLLQRLPDVPADECQNLIAALRSDKPTALSKLTDHAAAADDASAKVRYSIVALHLGEPGATKQCLRVGADPSLRTALIHDFADWHGDLRDIVPLLAAEPDGEFVSGLCSAIGRVRSELLSREERTAVVEMLARLSVHAADGATHSASRWALTRWKHPARAMASGSAAEFVGKRWYVNQQGINMIALSPGETESAAAGGPARPFYLASREVSIEQFARFVAADQSFASAHAADSWAFVSSQETPACPVNNVNWLHALLFCNWLSDQEGLPRSYTQGGDSSGGDSSGGDGAGGTGLQEWHCDLNAAGYRLPTKAEWQWACRAGSAADYDFHFGQEDSLLAEYGWYLNNSGFRVQPVGAKLPNAFGIFDMHGNVEEWCWADHDAGPAREVTRRDGPKRMRLLKPVISADGYVVCGGNCNNAAIDCAWNQVRGVPPGAGRQAGQLGNPAIGFRVARTKTEAP